MKGLYVLKEKRIYKRELPLWGSLLAAVLLAGCITLLALWCQPNALRTVLAGFKAQPLLIVLNALPIGLLLLAFAFLFRNVFYSGALVNFFVCALSLANRVKIEVRDEPVFPRDFSLLREVGSAIQSYDIRYPVKAIALVALTTGLLIGLGVLFPSRPASFASSVPFSVRSTSVHPVKRFSKFHSLSPCRSKTSVCFILYGLRSDFIWLVTFNRGYYRIFRRICPWGNTA